MMIIAAPCWGVSVLFLLAAGRGGSRAAVRLFVGVTLAQVGGLAAVAHVAPPRPASRPRPVVAVVYLEPIASPVNDDPHAPAGGGGPKADPAPPTTARTRADIAPPAAGTADHVTVVAPPETGPADSRVEPVAPPVAGPAESLPIGPPVPAPVAPRTELPPAAPVTAAADRWFPPVDGMDRVVYVLDASGSMNVSRFEALEKQLRLSLDALEDGTEFRVLFFNDALLEPHDREYTVKSAAAVEATMRRVAAVKPKTGGGTDPSEALLAGLAAAPNAVLLLSDGEFWYARGKSPEENEKAFKTKLDAMAAANAGGAIVHGTLIGGENSLKGSSIERIAAAFGGESRFGGTN